MADDDLRSTRKEIGRLANDQAGAQRAILEDYSPLEAPDPNQPKFRMERLHREILSWTSLLETGTISVEVALLSASETVRRALEDADNLMRISGPESAVGRLHTAMHGLTNLGVRADDVAKVLGPMATILDALNPVRNNAYMAHSNSALVGQSEAVLVINTVRTLLTYLEARRREVGRSLAMVADTAEPF